MSAALSLLVEQVRQTVRAGGADERTDRELLRAHSAGQDPCAFAVLVRRHAALVWHVCRRGTHHHQDAEDAFQATFLVLARRAAEGGWHDGIAPWLHAVAQRTAARARARALPRSLPSRPEAGP